MSCTLLPAVEINPSSPATASVICLHGLGADGYDLASLATELNLPLQSAVRFVFPHAPLRAVTINGGHQMRAWYDIVGADLAQREDDAGIRDSERLLGAWIAHEIDAGIAASRIVLAGFSQGGAIALQTGLRYPQRLAGVLALSCYLPLASSAAAEVHPANTRLPIMLAHGLEDDIVPVARAANSRDALQLLGYPVTWRTYAMRHTLCRQEIQDISGWLVSVLDPI